MAKTTTKKATTLEPFDNRDRIEPDLRPLAHLVDSVKRDSHQSNTHDRRSIEEIKGSLSDHGQKKPIYVLRSTMEVKAGNGTLIAAQELGWTYLAMVISDDPEEEARKYAIRDNRTHQFSEFDPGVLAAELGELAISHVDIGWTEEEWAIVEAEKLVADFEFDSESKQDAPDDMGDSGDGDGGVAVKIRFHPAVWLAKRENLLTLFGRIEHDYDAKVKIDE